MLRGLWLARPAGSGVTYPFCRQGAGAQSYVASLGSSSSCGPVDPPRPCGSSSIPKPSLLRPQVLSPG